jgi:hypothetical protein
MTGRWWRKGNPHPPAADAAPSKFISVKKQILSVTMNKINTHELEEIAWTFPKGTYDFVGKQVSEALGRDPASTDAMKRYLFYFTPPRAENSPKLISDLLTDFGVVFIDENSKNPFFLLISHYDVHVQLCADRDLIGT